MKLKKEVKRPLFVAMEVLAYEDQECMDSCVQFIYMQSGALSLNHTSLKVMPCSQRHFHSAMLHLVEDHGTAVQGNVTLQCTAPQKQCSPSGPSAPKAMSPFRAQAPQKAIMFTFSAQRMQGDYGTIFSPGGKTSAHQMPGQQLCEHPKAMA